MKSDTKIRQSHLTLLFKILKHCLDRLSFPLCFKILDHMMLLVKEILDVKEKERRVLETELW